MEVILLIAITGLAAALRFYRTLALIKDRHKLISYFGYKDRKNGFELYDLDSDPEEMTDLYNSNNIIATELQELLDLHREEINEPFTR